MPDSAKCSWKRRTSSGVALSGDRFRNAAKRLKEAEAKKTKGLHPLNLRGGMVAASKKGNGTTRHYALTDVITVLVKENPKQEGSAARKRFSLYKSGMTVEAAFAAGLWAADIRHDSKREHIKLTAK
jgi:hypothetical protein